MIRDEDRIIKKGAIAKIVPFCYILKKQSLLLFWFF